MERESKRSVSEKQANSFQESQFDNVYVDITPEGIKRTKARGIGILKSKLY